MAINTNNISSIIKSKMNENKHQNTRYTLFVTRGETDYVLILLTAYIIREEKSTIVYRPKALYTAH